jgi:hypothetical protein
LEDYMTPRPNTPGDVRVVELRGYPCDEWNGTPMDIALGPPEVVVAFRRPSARFWRGHVTFDPANPYLPLATSAACRLRDADHGARHAVYAHGDLDPAFGERRQRELTPA